MFTTSLTLGLTDSQHQILLKVYGPNSIPEPPKPSIFKMLLSQLTDFIIVVLIIVAIIEPFVDHKSGEPYDLRTSSVLLVVVVLNVIIGFTQEYKATKALAALMSLTVPKVVFY